MSGSSARCPIQQSKITSNKNDIQPFGKQFDFDNIGTSEQIAFDEGSAETHSLTTLQNVQPDFNFDDGGCEKTFEDERDAVSGKVTMLSGSGQNGHKCVTAIPTGSEVKFLETASHDGKLCICAT